LVTATASENPVDHWFCTVYCTWQAAAEVAALDTAATAALAASPAAAAMAARYFARLVRNLMTWTSAGGGRPLKAFRASMEEH
jgi:hypothetical protein